MSGHRGEEPETKPLAPSWSDRPNRRRTTTMPRRAIGVSAETARDRRPVGMVGRSILPAGAWIRSDRSSGTKAMMARDAVGNRSMDRHRTTRRGVDGYMPFAPNTVGCAPAPAPVTRRRLQTIETLAHRSRQGDRRSLKRPMPNRQPGAKAGYSNERLAAPGSLPFLSSCAAPSFSGPCDPGSPCLVRNPRPGGRIPRIAWTRKTNHE